MRGKIRIFLFLFFTWLAALSAVELKIICTADLHGRADRLAYLGAAIRKEKPDILLDCGDSFSGNFYSDADGGKQALEIMAEAIQSAPEEAAGQAWGVTITPGRVARYQ